MKRISVVHHIKILAVSRASQVIIGDAVMIKAKTRALAVQRQIAVFFKADGNFENYPLFTKKIPKSVTDERITMNIEQQAPTINVRSVHILGVVQSSTIQIGSTCIIDTEARIKHFRQFVTSVPSAPLPPIETIINLAGVAHKD
jgi:spore germination protein PE